MKVCVVIPSRNEAKSIGSLVNELKKNNIGVLVIDDGSSDDTAKIAQEHGAIVIQHPKNKGKGMSLREGFNFAIDEDYDAVITMDGDGQHEPTDIPRFINEAKNNNAKIILGNRMNNPQSMPWIRQVTNKFMSKIISSFCKQEIPDSQSGFRFISTDLLKKLNLSTDKFEIESEVLIQASRSGHKIHSIPIKSIYQGQASKINPFIDTLRFIRFSLRELWTLMF